MEWNSKWEWENLDVFGSKGVTSPRKLQSTDWGEDIDGSLILSGVVGESGGSASDVGNNSTSASIESSFKEGIKTSNYSGFPESYIKKKEFREGELNRTSSFEASVCSSEQSIGLKLGKRTYFENGFARSNTPDIPVSSISTMKKVKLSCQTTSIPRCQVEGCNLDLSSAKEYHRKHKVCEIHSKSLKVVVGGLERRFCQQCSRFHGLSEFDGKKRSCRRRLSDHNARRRKPQQETIQFNSRNPSSSFYDGQQQLSFVFNNVPGVQSKPDANFDHSVVSIKAEKPRGHDGLTHSLNGSNAEALDFRRALSLLSNNSWGSIEPDFSAFNYNMYTNGPSMAQPVIHSAPHGLPLPSPPEYWHIDHQAIEPNTHATQFQDSRILKTPYGIQYVDSMDEILKPL